jgi:hypothetical protein
VILHCRLWCCTRGVDQKEQELAVLRSDARLLSSDVDRLRDEDAKLRIRVSRDEQVNARRASTSTKAAALAVSCVA